MKLVAGQQYTIPAFTNEIRSQILRFATLNDFDNNKNKIVWIKVGVNNKPYVLKG